MSKTPSRMIPLVHFLPSVLRLISASRARLPPSPCCRHADEGHILIVTTRIIDQNMRLNTP